MITDRRAASASRRKTYLKSFSQLLGTTSLTPPRKVRLQAHAAKLSNTRTNAIENFWKIERANLFLRQHGVGLIQNEGEPRVFHIWTEPRRVYTSPWHFTLVDDAMGRAWLDDGSAGHVLRFLKAQGLDEGAPVPRSGQCLIHRASLRGGRGLDYYGPMARLGGPTDQELKRRSETKAKINAAIMRLRDEHVEFVRRCEALEDGPLTLANTLYLKIEIWNESNRRSKHGFDWDLVHPRVRPLADGRLIPGGNDHEQGVNWLIPECLLDDEDLPAWRPSRRKLAGTFGAASESRRLDPSTPIELREPKKGSAWMKPKQDKQYKRWSQI